MLQKFFTLILHAVKPDIKIAVDPDVKILAIFGTNIAFISRVDISGNQGNTIWHQYCGNIRHASALQKYPSTILQYFQCWSDI